MELEQAKELHSLMFKFMGIFHEKFIAHFRRHFQFEPKLKKNHGKTIHILYQHDGLTATELGKMLDLEKGGLTTIIDQLEEMGLVKRVVDFDDRRKTLLFLTRAGREQMDQAIEELTSGFSNIFHGVSPEEIEDFMLNLKSVVNFLQKL
ncbi:MarR family transcriptional regulator [Bacillota bacterium LX-D]|nr:MarR family transcriptional regulator [Bacillota bacterium LX-D]